MAEYVDTLGTLRLLSVIRVMGFSSRMRARGESEGVYPLLDHSKNHSIKAAPGVVDRRSLSVGMMKKKMPKIVFIHYVGVVRPGPAPTYSNAPRPIIIQRSGPPAAQPIPADTTTLDLLRSQQPSREHSRAGSPS
ncbi:hypothetical protein M422DRAFT_276692 [Sphaerobolus stellatus SS14]|uniref:Uncharacterized protein n=1 Tax=Sphaerobolus stellatus (strain SS14) TaxID=990650 RepID=A0A0C9T201_SPHS4|nr:hypothetical protein M422DRAFT_276692 [Sphaerobolus stellatus SS14]